MPEILQLCRKLEAPAEQLTPDDCYVRTFRGRADIPIWLDLRHRAFARARVGVRQWDEADFEQEFLSKPWWRDEHLWFVEHHSSLIGTVALAQRAEGAKAKAVVHWLAVLPVWRRHGIGRALMHVLESRAWELGYREVWLETHAAWTEAVQFYRRLGYAEVVTQCAPPLDEVGSVSQTATA